VIKILDGKSVGIHSKEELEVKNREIQRGKDVKETGEKNASKEA